jgi:hypothetical protein
LFGFISGKRLCVAEESFVLWASPAWVTDSFRIKLRGKNTLFIKSGVLAQEDNIKERFRKGKVAKGSQLVVTIGDPKRCPGCGSTGRVVWISEDKKTMGVQCRASHSDVGRENSRFGARVIVSTKSRKNVVFLTALC